MPTYPLESLRMIDFPNFHLTFIAIKNQDQNFHDEFKDMQNTEVFSFANTDPALTSVFRMQVLICNVYFYS